MEIFNGTNPKVGLWKPQQLWGSMCHYQAPLGPTKITPTLPFA